MITLPTQQEFEMGQEAREEVLAEWYAIQQELNALNLTLLDLWKREYKRWRTAYEKFRSVEHNTFYAPDKTGNAPSPGLVQMRGHRAALVKLIDAGHRCSDLLARLPLSDDQQKSERTDCFIQIETLLASLRESLQVWHPANKQDHEALRKLFP